VHGGLVGPGPPEGPPEALGEAALPLPRLSVPICMTPREWADDETLAIRKVGFEAGVTFNHWPHDTRKAAGAVKAAAAAQAAGVAVYEPTELTPEQAALL
jgi:hypothetical protein